MIPDDKARDTFRDMLYIRRFEEAVLELWDEHSVETHKHVYIGQEAVAAGILQLLREDDHLTTTHRNHGHVLLRGVDPGQMLAETLGRRDGCNRGRAGSGGITVPEAGFLFTTGQVGGGSGLATGGALAQRIQQKGGISVAFFGDGGLEEGITFESMNLAALHSLPVLFVCENNSVGVTTGRAENEWSSSSMAAETLGDIPRALQIETAVVNAEDVNAVYAAASELIGKIRSGDICAGLHGDACASLARLKKLQPVAGLRAHAGRLDTETRLGQRGARRLHQPTSTPLFATVASWSDVVCSMRRVLR